MHGLNVLIGLVSVPDCAPVVVAQRLRKGSTSSARGAASFVARSLVSSSKLQTKGIKLLVRADSAYYSRSVVAAAQARGADISVTVGMDPPPSRRRSPRLRMMGGKRSTTRRRSSMRTRGGGANRDAQSREISLA
ncbi:hypothetical protein GCM10023166_31260 [Paeniglutamicibacter cryotolerans]